MAGVRVANRVKFSVYLRQQVVDILTTLGREGDRKTSASISKAIGCHKSTQMISAGVIASAKKYIRNLIVDEEDQPKSERVQAYLTQDEADYLERYARENTYGNKSVAVNEIIREVAAIAVVSPGLFTQFYEANK